MKRGTNLRIAVDALDDGGAGVGIVRGDGSGVTDGGHDTRLPTTVRIAGALPGEDVTACVDSLSTQQPVAWASLRTIHRASPDRVTPACAAYGRCGGCVMQHLDVGAQLAWKDASLRQMLRAHHALAGVPVAPPVASPLPLGYRNNSKLVAARDDGGRLMLGAYAPRSHDVVDLAGCAVAEPALGPAAAALGDALRAHHVQPYDESLLVGTLRYATLRANARGQVLITLVTATDAFPAGTSVATELIGRHPNIVGVVQNINPSRGNAIYGDTERTLAGESIIHDQIGDVRLRVSSRAFFQANRHVAHAAYQAIIRALAPTKADLVVDAYAGVGGIALTLAATAGSVLGIEEHAAAVHAAMKSADLNQTTNARFVADDVARALVDVSRADLLVLNPPRKGCAPEVLRRSATLAPRAIAYLSCAPATLLRDIELLASLGYRPDGLTLFDMLPHTTHSEVLAILVRSGH
ncbi:MAG: 23S rRNA (uracil(1939)-C(5))-methyltransferase RlmD [Pseudomonadota bacterium]